MQMFDPLPCVSAADTTNGCQMMSYSHAKRDLNGNKYLNSNLK